MKLEEIANDALKNIVNETPADPPSYLRSATLYHGTPSKKAYEQIKQQGLKYDDAYVYDKYKDEPDFAPMEGGVYLTKSLGNAIRYACFTVKFHGDYKDYEAELETEPYAYVFEFSGEDLTKVTPDEDELGGLLVRMVQHKNLKPKLQAIVNKIPSGLMNLIKNWPSDFQTHAVAGKWLLQSGLSEVVTQYLMKNKENVVNYDTIHPRSVIIIQKPPRKVIEELYKDIHSFDGYVKWAKNHSKRINL